MTETDINKNILTDEVCYVHTLKSDVYHLRMSYRRMYCLYQPKFTEWISGYSAPANKRFCKRCLSNIRWTAREISKVAVGKIEQTDEFTIRHITTKNVTDPSGPVELLVFYGHVPLEVMLDPDPIDLYRFNRTTCGLYRSATKFSKYIERRIHEEIAIYTNKIMVGRWIGETEEEIF